MKAIKITADNAATIEAALAEVNGKARQHTYTDYSEIEALARGAEKRLEQLNIAKVRRAGASFTETSGSAVANSYKNTRIGTTATIERKGAGWYLVAVSAATLFSNGGGKGRLTMTAAQDAEAVAEVVAALKSGYSVK